MANVSPALCEQELLQLDRAVKSRPISKNAETAVICPVCLTEVEHDLATGVLSCKKGCTSQPDMDLPGGDFYA